MCESTAYILRGDKEDLFLESVCLIRPEGDGLVLKGMFGEQKNVRARIKEVDLMGHKIILQPISNDFSSR